MDPIVLFFIGLCVLTIISSLRIIQEYERGVIFRLGKALQQVKGPGLIFIMPYGIDRVVKVDLRVLTLDVPAQDVITRDNVSVKVNAVVYFQVTNARQATLAVSNYLYATSQLAQTTLRSVCGQQDLDQLLSARDRINDALKVILDKHTEPWGVTVNLVEVKQIDLPTEMQRAMAKQAEAERERRAKVIHALGEQEAATKLTEAANVMQERPMSLQLRYLQTLSEIAVEKNSTIVFPIPIEFMQLVDSLGGKKHQ